MLLKVHLSKRISTSISNSYSIKNFKNFLLTIKFVFHLKLIEMETSKIFVYNENF